MSNYEYKDLTSEGWRKFSISNRDQSRIFKYRKPKWCYKYEYYHKNKTIHMQRLPSFIYCLLSTLFFPFGVILLGVFNFKEIYRESILYVWCSKKYGKFSSDYIYQRDNGDKTFESLLEVAKWK